MEAWGFGVTSLIQKLRIFFISEKTKIPADNLLSEEGHHLCLCLKESSDLNLILYGV